MATVATNQNKSIRIYLALSPMARPKLPWPYFSEKSNFILVRQESCSSSCSVLKFKQNYSSFPLCKWVYPVRPAWAYLLYLKIQSASGKQKWQLRLHFGICVHQGISCFWLSIKEKLFPWIWLHEFQLNVSRTANPPLKDAESEAFTKMFKLPQYSCTRVSGHSVSIGSRTKVLFFESFVVRSPTLAIRTSEIWISSVTSMTKPISSTKKLPKLIEHPDHKTLCQLCRL